MFIPFIVVIPGMIAAVLVPETERLKAGANVAGVTYNDSMLLLLRDVLPNGLLGVALAGLLAAFMAGMAANISAFNTVFSYDIWQRYIRKDRPDGHYLKVGRWATVAATVLAIGTALIASGYSNLMNTVGAVIVWGLDQVGVFTLPGQGAAFVAAGVAFVVDIVVSVGVSMATAPKPAAELVGLVYSETPEEQRTDPEASRLPWFRSPTKLAGIESRPSASQPHLRGT